MPIVHAVLATPEVAAELAVVLEEAVERKVAVDGWRFSPEALQFVEDLQAFALAFAQVRARRVASNVAHATVPARRPGTVSCMTTKEVAQAQSVTVAAVAARCRRGTVPGARRGPKGWRIPVSYVRRSTR